MRNTMRSAVALFAWLVTALPGAPALALNAKSYVSNTGSNANACDTPATACLTFPAAIVKTAAGGEISVVNTGNYGEFFIGKAINITNDGAGEASILATGAFAVIGIQTGVGEVVSLRGLVIDGQGVGGAGMQITQVSALHVQNCVIRNFESPNSTGINFLPLNSSQLFVSDTIVFNNGASSLSTGIRIVPQSPSGGTSVVLERLHVENNVSGIRVVSSNNTANGAHVVIRDSVISGNVLDGIHAVTLPGKAAAFIVVERTASVNNGGTGIVADGPGATILLDDNTVARNGVGINVVNGGQLISYGNNKVNNNLGPDGVPTGSYSPI